MNTAYRLRIRRGWPPWRRAAAVVRGVGVVADIARTNAGGWEAKLLPYANRRGPGTPMSFVIAPDLPSMKAALKEKLRSPEGPWWWERSPF